MARSEALKKAQAKYAKKHRPEMKRNVYKSHAYHFITDWSPTHEELVELKKLVDNALLEEKEQD